MKTLALATILGASAWALADGAPPNLCKFTNDAGVSWLGDAGTACFTFTGECGTCSCPVANGCPGPGELLECTPDAGDVCPPGTPTATSSPVYSSSGGSSGATSTAGTTSGGSTGAAVSPGGGCSSAGRALGPWLIAGGVPLLLLRRKRRRS